MSNWYGLLKEKTEADSLANLYRAERTEKWGATDDLKFVTGLTLVPLDEERFDLLGEELVNVGTDASILIPQGGLVEGATYRAVPVNEHVDWETGYVDEYDIKLVRVEDAA